MKQLGKVSYLDTKKIHKDILIRLIKIEKPQKYLTEKIGISRATFWRLSKGEAHELKVGTLLKLVDWLEKDITHYIKLVKMTPTEEKAKEKAKELIGVFYDDSNTSIINNEMAIKCCNQIIEVLGSVKGRGKIHKLNFWKLVLKNIQDEK